MIIFYESIFWKYLIEVVENDLMNCHGLANIKKMKFMPVGFDKGSLPDIEYAVAHDKDTINI